MTVGLTYVRGRTVGTTTETGTMTRETGQFGATFKSCPVRSSGSHRMKIASDGMTASSGGLIIYFDPDYIYNSGSLAARAPLAELAYDADDYILIEYIKPSGFYITLFRSGVNVGQAHYDTLQFTAGLACVLYVAWNGSNVYCSANGGTIQSGAQTNSPAGLPSIFDIGYCVAFGTYMDAAFGAVVALNGPITQTQWELFAALRSSRPPLFGEIAPDEMVGLWYGAHSRVWTLSSTGACMDFLNTTGVKVQKLDGTGVPPMEHRNVETPLRDGASYVDSRMRSRALDVSFTLFAGTFVLVRTLMKDVAERLNPRAGQGVIMYAPDTLVYEIDAVLDAGLAYDNHVSNRMQRARTRFLCFDPAWRVAALNETSQSIAAAGLYIPLTIPLELSESAVDFTLTNDGALPVYPVVEFTAGSSGCEGLQVENTTTGKLFKVDGYNVAAGDVVTIDMEERTVELDDGTDLMTYRSASSQMWPLEVGSNAITASVDVGSATVRVRYATRPVGV